MIKKVLFLSGMYPSPTYPQYCIFVHELAKSLCNAGIDVDVVVPITIYNKQKYPKKSCIEGINIRYIRYFKFPGSYNYYFSGFLLYLSLLVNNINFSKYDIIHAHSVMPEGYAAYLISLKTGIPYIIHVHGLDVCFDSSYKDSKTINKLISKCKIAYESTSAITCVSQKVANNILKIQPNAKINIVYNGVDTNRFYPIVHKKDIEFNILSIGNLIQIKGHDFLLYAFRKLIDEGITNIKLKIIGRGPKEKELKDLAEKLNIADKVEFFGYIPYENVACELKQADLFVLPSYYEALGCVYLEAMASGVPVIGCENNGIDEIIQNKQNGLLCKPKDVESLKSSMKLLICDESLRMKVVKNGIACINNNYTWEHSAKKLINIYKNIVAKGNL